MGCEIYANNMVPAGSYICLNCKKETVLHLKDYLPPCNACGGDVFALNAMIDLSEEEIKKKFTEITELMIMATYFTEEMKMDGFVPVLALNLKMLLANDAESLLPRLFPNFTFDKATPNYKNNIVMPDELFALPFEQIRIDEFLNQTVVFRGNREPITVIKMIDTVVEKQGIHAIKESMHEDEYLSASSAKFYFPVIAKHIIRKIGINYEEKIKEILFKIQIKNFNPSGGESPVI
ncbi:MAG: hypothetical protein IJC74_01160 [Clostridia bacterium]|nr:hypothetical protein [Clostridia bacterium]